MIEVFRMRNFSILKNVIFLSSVILISAIATIYGNPPTSTNSDYLLELAFPNIEIEQPVDFQIPDDGTNRIFIVSQIGIIYTFNNTRFVNQTNIFLDIREKVSCCWELGLLSLAFHPNFKENGHFYVYYTAEPPESTRLARYTADKTNPNQADISSELIIIEQNQPFVNHNGGQVVFGPDGFLYLSLGDGGGDHDPYNNAQNKSSLLGKILRINVDNSSAGKNYVIPADNPFANNTNRFREEIFAYGLRNPWRFSFDPETGLLWNADVGQNQIEEINLIFKGYNYGWNLFEGTLCNNLVDQLCNRNNITFPIHEYDHQIGKSITGGFVYRGSRLLDLYGYYIYADFVSGRIWALKLHQNNQITNLELLNSNIFITSFGKGLNNELYAVAYDGRIYQLNFINKSASN